MNLVKALTLGESLFKKFGLNDWQLDLDNAVRRAGQCAFAKKKITLSKKLTLLYSEEEVRQTLLHEIAHALIGPDHGHDEHWKKLVTSLGGIPLRSVATTAPTPTPKWRGVCPNGHQINRYRKTKKPVSCAVCSSTFNSSYLIAWRLYS